MPEFRIINAKEKDIEILTSMKLVTMIDDEMDKKLSHKEKNKIKDSITSNIELNYKKYKMILVDQTVVGAYLVDDYLDGQMLDELYLFKDYRRKGIGSKILRKLIKSIRKLYVWVYASNSVALEFFRKFGFITVSDGGRTIILKYDSIYSDVTKVLEDINVGYVDKDGNKYLSFNDNFKDIYSLQGTREILNTKIGLSFDQVELERELLSKLNIDLRTYFIYYPSTGDSHSFLIYKDNGKYYWFEHAWLKYKGIHEYDNKNDLLVDVIGKFVNIIPNGDVNKIKLYLFDKPRKGINYTRYMSNAINGKNIKIN